MEDIIVSTSGPLKIAEIKLLRARFDHETVKEWVSHWESNEISTAMASVEKVESILERIEEDERIILSEFAAIGGRADGENIRKSLTLRGHNDVSRTMKSLANKGLILPLVMDENNISLSELIHKPTFFHREFAIAATVLTAVVSDERIGANIETREDLEPQQKDDAKQMALNFALLHHGLKSKKLSLTKQDLPNRRSVQTLAEKLWVPGSGNLTLSNDTELSDFSFLVAILFGMELISIESSEISAHNGEAVFTPAHFVEGFLTTEWWNENRRGGVIQNTASSLPALRRYVLSVFTRIETEQWISIETLVRYCLAVDRAFVEHALQGTEMPMEKFVKKWVKAMHLLGGIEISSDDNQDFIRKKVEEESEIHKSFVPQPNGEISVFFDPLHVSQFQELLNFAEISDRQEKTIIFALNSQSMQLGFGGGLSDKTMEAYLSEHSVTPIPETIRFQISDGYRVHKQHTIYRHGQLIRCRDYDNLDMALGQLKHENPDAIIVHLSSDTVFVSGIDLNGMTRLFSDPVRIDQELSGPCFKFSDTALKATYDPFRANISTSAMVQNITEFDKKTRSVVFDPDKINANFDGFDDLIAFLEPRTENGVPAEQRVAFRNALTGGTSAQFRDDITILWIEDEVLADALYELDSLSKVLVRLGPYAFEVDSALKDKVGKELKRLNIEMDNE